MQLIRDSQQIRALRTLKRQAIVDILDATGPRTVAEIAALMSCAPSRLYYHVQRLSAVGLVKGQVVSDRAGRRFVVYAIPRRQPKLAYVPDDEANVHAVTAVVASMLREAARLFRQGLRPGVEAAGTRREIWAGRRVGWLTPGEREELNRMLHGMISLFKVRRHPPRSARMYALTFSLSPFNVGRAATTVRHRKRRRRG